MVRASIGFAFFLLTATGAAGCNRPVDLLKALEVQDVSSGWFDAGMVNGQNKLVPSVTFKIKNVSNETLNVLQINALFRRGAEEAEWGSGFVTVAGSEGLQAGATSPSITVKSQFGYSGSEPRQQMLQNSQFVDAKVQLFAKYASVQWTRIAEYPVSRTLLSK